MCVKGLELAVSKLSSKELRRFPEMIIPRRCDGVGWIRRYAPQPTSDLLKRWIVLR